MLKQEQVKTPELNKMMVIQEHSQKIGGFLEWLNGKGIELGIYDESAEEIYPVTQTKEQLLAEFFEIDLAKCEKERQALLGAIQEDNS